MLFDRNERDPRTLRLSTRCEMGRLVRSELGSHGNSAEELDSENLLVVVGRGISNFQIRSVVGVGFEVVNAGHEFLDAVYSSCAFCAVRNAV